MATFSHFSAIYTIGNTRVSVYDHIICVVYAVHYCVNTTPESVS